MSDTVSVPRDLLERVRVTMSKLLVHHDGMCSRVGVCRPEAPAEAVLSDLQALMGERGGCCEPECTDPICGEIGHYGRAESGK